MVMRKRVGGLHEVPPEESLRVTVVVEQMVKNKVPLE